MLILDVFERLRAAELRHHVVEQHDVVMLAAEAADTFAAAGGEADVRLRLFKQALRDEAVHLVVIDDEDVRVRHDERGRMHALALGHAFRIEVADGFFRPHAQRNPRREDRAFAIGALDRDRAAHAAGEAEREREAEARALDVAVALRIEAYEVAEQPLPVLWFDADARILDPGDEQDVSCWHDNALRCFLGLCAKDGQRDTALARVFHSIRQEVHDDLLHARAIAVERGRQLRIDHDMEIEPFLFRAQAHERADALVHVREAEFRQRELHLARFDFREVEDVIDEVQQRLPGFMRTMRVGTGVFFAALAQDHLVHAEDGVDRRADFVRHVREERALCLAGLVGLHHAALAREEIGRADGEQQHEHGEHPDDEPRDGEQAAVERRRWHEADDLAVHALEVGHKHDVLLLIVERGRRRAVEARAQLAQDAAELHAVNVAAVGL